jgi:hypothetical protein
VQVAFGYSPDKVLYSNVDLGVDLDSRVAIVGPNGAGKVRADNDMEGRRLTGVALGSELAPCNFEGDCSQADGKQPAQLALGGSATVWQTGRSWHSWAIELQHINEKQLKSSWAATLFALQSTLLKLMVGALEPLDGMVKRHNHLRIGQVGVDPGRQALWPACRGWSPSEP